MYVVLSSLADVLFNASHGLHVFLEPFVSHLRTCIAVLWLSLLFTWPRYTHPLLFSLSSIMETHVGYRTCLVYKH